MERKKRWMVREKEAGGEGKDGGWRERLGKRERERERDTEGMSEREREGEG